MARCNVNIVGTPREHQRKGATLLSHAYFTAADTGTSVDPTTVQLLARNGADGAIVVLAATKRAVGSYDATVALDADGAWYLRWEAAGTYVGGAEDQLIVSPSRFS